MKKLKEGDIITISFGNKEVKVEVLDVQETVKKEETEPTNETNLISNNISQCVSYVILVGIWLFTGWLIYFSLGFISKCYLDKNVKLILTPFIFMSIVFVASLIATDSIIKTIKYNYRAKESVIGNLIQSLLLAGLAAFMWWNNR